MALIETATKYILDLLTENEEVKKDIIDDKLAELKDNPIFMQELTSQLTAYAAEKRKSFNIK